MDALSDKSKKPPHLRIAGPSPWVRRFAHLVPDGGTVLDLTCGGGRHSRLFLGMGRKVVAIDRDLDYVADLRHHPDAELIQADLEDGSHWPLSDRAFAGVVVVYYVNRPLFRTLLDSLEPGGVFICESFARSDKAPDWLRRPDHLLSNGELLDLVRGRLQVVAYEHGLVESPFPDRPHPGIVQRICAVNDVNDGDGRKVESPPHPLTSPSRT
jgi:SAM-dependent methyltransferase